MAPSTAAAERVKVVVRCRPLSGKEVQDGRRCVLEVDKALGQVLLRGPGGGGDAKTFAFDAVFDQDSSQREVYARAALAIVAGVLEGYNGTFFAYVQTGTG